MFYCFRIHDVGSNTSRDRVVEFFRKFDGACFIVREVDAERPHYQGIVWSELKHDTVSGNIKKFFELTGNTQYSNKGMRKDIDSNLRYLCKGCPKSRGSPVDVVYRQVFDVDVRKLHEEYWDENDALKKKGQTSRTSLVEEVYKHFKDVQFQEYGEKRREICRHIVRLINERNGPLNVYYARGIFNAVMCRLDERYVEDIVEEIISKY